MTEGRQGKGREGGPYSFVNGLIKHQQNIFPFCEHIEDGEGVKYCIYIIFPGIAAFLYAFLPIL